MTNDSTAPGVVRCERREYAREKPTLRRKSRGGRPNRGSQDNFSAARDVKDGDLLAALFSDLPSSVRESVPADEISVREQGVSDSGRVQKGIVSDLYHRPNGGWEAYISSITEKCAVYKFTSTSCVCPFLVCLGSTIEF